MKVWVKAAEGRRLPIGGGRTIPAEGCEVECTPFVQSLIDSGDALLMEAKEIKVAAKAAPDVKEG